MKKSISILFLFLIVICILDASETGGISFAKRVILQKRIEDIYWQHRLWPSENPEPKPALSLVMPDAAIQVKTQEYLQKSGALQMAWNRPISTGMLQAEMDRMAAHTRNPAFLRRIWGALNDDPEIIAECLIRPLLVRRLASRTPGFNTWWNRQGKRTQWSLEIPRHHYRLPRINDFHLTDSNDFWTYMSVDNAPSARARHTAVWTGTEMIVWGGTDGQEVFRNGGSYDPAEDTWNDIEVDPTIGRKAGHKAVWTGTEMIVWGGEGSNGSPVNTGGLYNPQTNHWRQTSTDGAPSARKDHTAVWTGREMIVWGGNQTSSGGRFNPVNQTWVATSTNGAPSKRSAHTAVWTGREMIIWGGVSISSYVNTGARYAPGTDSWSATSVNFLFTPSARTAHTAVWSGSRMIVWGGFSGQFLSSGGMYDPVSDVWARTPSDGAPSGRVYHSAIWSGWEMIVWGGKGADEENFSTGGRFDPETYSWSETATYHRPGNRYLHTGVWSGREMIIWGGANDYLNGTLNTGGRYTPIVQF